MKNFGNKAMQEQEKQIVNRMLAYQKMTEKALTKKRMNRPNARRG